MAHTPTFGPVLGFVLDVMISASTAYGWVLKRCQRERAGLPEARALKKRSLFKDRPCNQSTNPYTRYMSTRISEYELSGAQRITKSFGGRKVKRVLRDVVVLPEPLYSNGVWGHCATANVTLWGRTVAVHLRCTKFEDRFVTFGWAETEIEEVE